MFSNDREGMIQNFITFYYGWWVLLCTGTRCGRPPGLGFLVEHCNVQLCLPFPVWEMFLWEGQLVTCYAGQPF